MHELALSKPSRRKAREVQQRNHQCTFAETLVSCRQQFALLHDRAHNAPCSFHASYT